MIKKFFLPLALLSCLFSVVDKAHSGCVEVSLSTCVGDFADGGDLETSNRLLGNTSAYSLGIIQDNKPRIWISSGSDTIAGRTNTITAGFVGIHMKATAGQIPQHHLDVYGRIRSTGSAYFATSSGAVAIGVNASTAAGSLVDVRGGSVTIHGPNAGLRVVGGFVLTGGATMQTITWPDGSVSTTGVVGGSFLDTSGSTQTKSGGLNLLGLAIGDSITTGEGNTPLKVFRVVNVGEMAVEFRNNGASQTGQRASLNLYPNNSAQSSGVKLIAKNEATGDGSTSLGFWTWNGSADGERMRLTASGNLGVGESTVTSRLDVSNGSVTVRGTNAALEVRGGTVTALAISVSSLTGRGVLYNLPPADGTSGQVLATNGSGGLSWATDQTGGAGGSGSGGISTFTFTLKSGGDAVLSTHPFVAIPGAFDVVGKSTITIFEVQAFNLDRSSIGWTSYNIARTTQTQTLAQSTTWQYLIFDSTVGTNGLYSVWTSTRFNLYPGWAYSLHVTSSPSNPGQKPGNYGIKMRGLVEGGGD